MKRGILFIVLAVSAIIIFGCSENKSPSSPAPAPTSPPADTATISPTSTNTPDDTVTVTQTNTPSPSVTQTFTVSKTVTQTSTKTSTPTITQSHTVSPTPSVTSTVTATATVTRTNTPMPLSTWTSDYSSGTVPYVSGHAMVEYSGSVWILYSDEVYKSTNMIDWTTVTKAAQYDNVKLEGAVVYNDGGGEKMWAFVNGANNNSVYYSTDGVDWTQTTGNATTYNVSDYSTVVFDNKMWIVGGYGSSGSYGVAYYSTDGITWTTVTGIPAYSYHVTLVFDGYMWLVGGYTSLYSSNVWRSSDGINWSPVTTALFTARINHAGFVYDGKMWIFGGRTGGSQLSPITNCEVWYSEDGYNWKMPTGNFAGSRYSSRGIMYSAGIAFDAGSGTKAWIIGGSFYGSTGAPIGPTNDVWSAE